MADPGHKRTDKELEALEKRLNEVYTQSAKEMQKKLDDYFKRFQIKDEKWRQWLYDGEVTEEEYKQWRTGQMAVGKRWEKMRDRLVSDQMHTNQIAREIVDREMPGIFELNANYAIYQVEHDAQIDTSMTLYNREAVDMILRDDPDLLLPPGKKVSKAIQEGKAQRWEKQKIQSTLLQGILQGESIPKLAARLASEVNDSDHKAAVRNARTMATNAQNAGRYDAYDRLKNKGIDLTLEWAATLDNRTRHSHRMMHGQRRDVGEPFEVDGVKIMYPAQTGTFRSVSDVPQEMIWNCRCTILAWIKGYEHDTIKHSDKMGEMTFEEWLGAKSESQDILSQEKTGEEIKQGYIKEYSKKEGNTERLNYHMTTMTGQKKKDVVSLLDRLTSLYETRLKDVYDDAHGYSEHRANMGADGDMHLPKNPNLGTVAHEFGHSVATLKAEKLGRVSYSKDFTKEIRKLHKEYKQEVHRYGNRKYALDGMGYADDIDEFIAEAFSAGVLPEYSKHIDDRTYVEKAMEIIDKYFKKKKRRN